MIAADGRCIAVTGKHDDFKVRVSELDAGREGDWPAVSHMEGVHIEERARDPPPAAAPYHGDADNLLFRIPRSSTARRKDCAIMPFPQPRECVCG